MLQRPVVLIFILSIAIIAIVTLLVTISYYFSRSGASSNELSSAYECGFMPFNEARVQYEMRFYCISLLFIIFDIELVLLFPYIIIYKHVGLLGFVCMIIFSLLLIIGFAYEWLNGVFDFMSDNPIAKAPENNL